ncbi:MAG: hypothetical protein IPM61_05160 [Chlorobi bacterium]|nr:hypothetical protein [Chlorobiota bacterium]MBX7216271.1 hypothetical protein [Candidatus Kapabacteria bacterium]
MEARPCKTSNGMAMLPTTRSHRWRAVASLIAQFSIRPTPGRQLEACGE